nr:HAMP domain-containing sensor histidine kinase [Halomonas utahensis]
MSRSTTRRIEVINQTAYRIMHGDLSQRVPTRGTQDDFDQLADNLNQMLDRIEYLMEGIRHVSDSIAHDLRTPLTRLRSQLENTLINLKDTDAQEQVGEAVAEADQLLGTFNALLRIARLETGGKTLQSEPLELGTLVTDAVELYEALAEEKDQVLDYQAEEDVPLLGDRDLLFQAVSNLIDNAIKYTDEGGRIGVAVRREGGQAVLEVADSGDGVPDHEKENIFGRFYRVGKSRSQPGNGLGLSLVSAVVELHEGHIGLSDAEPDAERPGLKVTLYLPAQPPSEDSSEREQ